MAGDRWWQRAASRRRQDDRREEQPIDPIAALALAVALGSMVIGFFQYRVARQGIAVSREIAAEQLRFAVKAVEDSGRDTRAALALSERLAASGERLATGSEHQATEARRAVDSSLTGTRIALSSLQESRANARRQIRAYIQIDPVTEDFVSYDGDRVFGRYTLENAGASPAYQVKTWIAAWKRDLSNAALPDHDFRLLQTRSVIAKRETGNLLFPDLTAADAKAMIARKAPLTLALSVSYVDIFGDAHVTEYCVKWQASSFSPCAQHNDSD